MRESCVEDREMTPADRIAELEAKLAIAETNCLLAQNHGGECLSNEYVNSKTSLLWRCVKGHEWAAAPFTLRNRGTWCPYCARKAKLTIEEMCQIALSRSGKCLSQNYVNGSTKLHWRCQFGHEWFATPDNVKNGRRWCPICAK